MSQHFHRSWKTPLSAVFTSLLITSCGQIQLSEADKQLATNMGFDLDAALALKRSSGTKLEVYRRTEAASLETRKLERALKSGQTDGERGEMLANSLDRKPAPRATGLEARIPNSTAPETIALMHSNLQKLLPSGYTASLIDDGKSRFLVVEKTPIQK